MGETAEEDLQIALLEARHFRAEATLSAMKDDPDPIVRAHVADELKFRTWLGKGRR